MKTSSGRWLASVAVTLWSFGFTACSADPGADADVAAESAMADEVAAEPAPSDVSGEEVSAGASGEEASSEGDGEHATTEGRGEHGDEGEGGEHARSEGGGEHDEEGEGGEHGSGEEGEESGVQIELEETWDATRNGARLILKFDPASNAFIGTVENTTQQTLCAVRVEVHLSTGTELGPTARTDLPAGEMTAVELPTGGEAFDTWTTHPEMSRCEGA